MDWIIPSAVKEYEAEIADLKLKLKQAKIELEAQHRKTWALAMVNVVKRYNEGGGGDWNLDQAFMQELKTQFPCPPIEATKDK